MILYMTLRRPMQRPTLGRASVLLVFALALALGGCGSVEIREAGTPDADAVRIADVSPERDLAVGSLEISPDLSQAIGLSDGSTVLRLQTTVENRGRVEETDVLVEAWLRAPARYGGMVLLQAAEVVPSIEAGSAQPVQLQASGVVPILSAYVLEVSVRPARQEQYLGNNVAQYEIAVSAAEEPLG